MSRDPNVVAALKFTSCRRAASIASSYPAASALALIVDGPGICLSEQSTLAQEQIEHLGVLDFLDTDARKDER